MPLVAVDLQGTIVLCLETGLPASEMDVERVAAVLCDKACNGVLGIPSCVFARNLLRTQQGAISIVLREQPLRP